ncbi:MAG: hypothetical protein QM817_08600 [Archangium sp.]
MTRLSIALPVLLLSACAAQTTSPSGELLRANSEVSGLNGLERLEQNGPFVAGTTERFKLFVDETQITQATFSASAGTLTTSGRTAEWTLPTENSAELTVTLTRKDGSHDSATWSFRLTRAAATTNDGPTSAQQALLTTPMPVLDGGTLEISGGSCEVRYEGTTNNVAIAFNTETHPALMYGRWNGTAWTLEVVDAMGFNTGGVVQRYISMQVEANGTPHIVYVRDQQVMYATKSGGVWTRERVDSTTYPISTQLLSDETSAPSIALNGSTPVVLYAIGGTYSYRPVISTRTGANAWSQTSIVVPTLDVGDRQEPFGELTIDGTGRHLFPLQGAIGGNYRYFVVGWTPTTTTSLQLTQNLSGRSDAVLASPTRLLVRNSVALYDVSLNATLGASTYTYSSVESSSSSVVGDLAWSTSASKPLVLHNHSSTLELVTPNASGFWTYQQLGSTSGVSAGLTVHPGSGEASICYQANGRIMFQ